MISTFLTSLLFLGAAGACDPHLPSASAQDAEPVEVAVQPLSETAFRLNAGAANVGVFFGPDGVLIVDGSFLLHGPELEATIARLYFDWRERAQGVPVPEPGTEALPIRWQITTHWHGDHTGTNPFFGMAGAQIVAHSSVRAHLAGDPALADLAFSPPMDEAGLPDVLVEDALTIHFNGEDVHVLHIPGAHTSGDLVVWMPKSKIACTGDVYWSDGFPYIELRTGGRPKGIIRGVDRLLELVPADATLLPGHGEAGGVERLRAFRAMMADCDRQIRIAVRANKTLREVEDMHMFGEWEDDWSAGVRGRTKAFIRIMYYTYLPTGSGGVDEFGAEAARGEGEPLVLPPHDHGHPPAGGGAGGR